jgi:hypothetical protein
LKDAVICGNANRAEELIKLGADVNFVSSDGFEPFVLAARYGHTEVVGKLVDAGIDLDKQDNDGWTALMKAAYYGRTEIVEKLVHAGADLTIESCPGWNALRWAQRSEVEDNSAVVKILQEKMLQVEKEQAVRLRAGVRAEKREEIRRYKEKIKRLSANLTKTTLMRHELAVRLNEMRKEYGCQARKVAKDDSAIQRLRGKIARTR